MHLYCPLWQKSQCMCTPELKCLISVSRLLATVAPLHWNSCHSHLQGHFSYSWTTTCCIIRPKRLLNPAAAPALFKITVSNLSKCMIDVTRGKFNLPQEPASSLKHASCHDETPLKFIPVYARLVLYRTKMNYDRSVCRCCCVCVAGCLRLH